MRVFAANIVIEVLFPPRQHAIRQKIRNRKYFTVCNEIRLKKRTITNRRLRWQRRAAKTEIEEQISPPGNRDLVPSIWKRTQ